MYMRCLAKALLCPFLLLFQPFHFHMQFTHTFLSFLHPNITVSSFSSPLMNLMTSLFCSYHPFMLVGETPIRWWSGSTYLSSKPGVISMRWALRLSSFFFQKRLRVLPWHSASLRGGGTLPIPFISPSRR